MKGKKYREELDYERIVIYPYNHGTETRRKLYRALRELNIPLIVEQY